jgi:predicted nucleotidyltransferase
MPSIQRVILFGSLATGTPTPHSDADLLVIVNESVHHDARDRIPAALEALSPVPGPVDLFVLTAHEFEAARSSRAPLIREAVANGIDLL